MVNSQDQLLQRAIAKSSMADSQNAKFDTKRLGLLDDSGLERAKQYIEEQKKHLQNSKAQFVVSIKSQEKAKKTMTDTERRIDDEKKNLAVKKQTLEQDSKMMQEKLSGVAKDSHSTRNQTAADHPTPHRERDRSSKQGAGSHSGHGYIY